MDADAAVASLLDELGVTPETALTEEIAATCIRAAYGQGYSDAPAPTAAVADEARRMERRAWALLPSDL